MSYVPIRSGYTGPRAKIGGSTDYHIDLQLLESLPIGERVKALDTLAKQYKSLGREIEFSNPAVSGKRWNPEADLSDRVQLLNQAAAAHAHSRHPGWQSLDFYVPFKGKSRFDPGAVEDASIFIPGVAGGKVKRSSGGGYGYFSESLNPQGQVIFRVGHGNIDRPEQEAELAIPGAPQLPGPQVVQGQTQQQPEAQISDKEFLEKYIKENLESQLMSGMLSEMFQRKRKDPFAEFQEMMQAYGVPGISNPLL
jgi:hypothetical protein